MCNNSTVISVLQIYNGCCFHFCLGFKAAHVEHLPVGAIDDVYTMAWSTAASDIKAARNIENSVVAITRTALLYTIVDVERSRLLSVI